MSTASCWVLPTVGLVTAQVMAQLNGLSLNSCSPALRPATTAGRIAASVQGGVPLCPVVGEDGLVGGDGLVGAAVGGGGGGVSGHRGLPDCDAASSAAVRALTDDAVDDEARDRLELADPGLGVGAERAVERTDVAAEAVELALDLEDVVAVARRLAAAAHRRRAVVVTAARRGDDRDHQNGRADPGPTTNVCLVHSSTL